ncbi:hypothetical protein [Pelomonas cellulosilytica]|uniref:DUF4166 domain-containing protein n=1 Tax=Pelomonas cellulosilytica TaxID=2906762 RepID=A0ABS8XQN2_9BURK|nr:hypothetical protein [Pelomonas sp. P8]MCE4555049.1 hypothetical protein [Pelomonas sp. P8]
MGQPRAQSPCVISLDDVLEPVLFTIYPTQILRTVGTSLNVTKASHAMAKEWLNVFIDQAGASQATQWITAKDIAQLQGRTVRIHESDRSGAVTMSAQGLASYGDAEVYLKINLQNGGFRYLSAPLHTSIEVPGVQSLELTIVFLTGPAGTPYRALVNAHCVYELI